jgi:hypothetical protein
MDKEIDIFEYEWWRVFAGFFVIFIVSLFFLGLWYYEIQKTDQPWAFSQKYSFYNLFGFLFFGIGCFCLSIYGFLKIRYVPKLIVFRQDTINIVFPIGQEKVFSYSDISRFVIYQKSKWSVPQRWAHSRVILYFSNSNIKVVFNPARLLNSKNIIEIIHNKGLGNIIEQKWQ